MPTFRVGGSFAPRIDNEKLNVYRELASQADGPVGEAMSSLCDMVETFYQTGESQLEGQEHPLGEMRYPNGAVQLPPRIVPLEQAEIDRIFDVVPWKWEVDALKGLFEGIPVEQKGLRDAAFHLLWYAVELEKDREPLTNDKIRMIAPGE